VQRHDAVVAGAGPAGAIAALVLARAGADVALVDRARFPRDKVCGDCLIADSLLLLEELGLSERIAALGHRMGALRVLSPSGRSLRLEGRFVGILRRKLDHELVRCAVEAGAVLYEGCKVTGPRDGGGVLVEGEQGVEEMGARLVILCTGANVLPVDEFGLLERAAPTAMALRAYYRLQPGRLDEDTVVISYVQPILPGYGWIFPMGGGVVNVGCGVFLDDGGPKANLRDLFERYVQGCPATGPAMEGAEPLGPLAGAQIRTGLSGARPSADGVLAAGEAIGMTYSLSGEGIGKAMQSGRLAAEVGLEALEAGDVSAGFLRRYDQRLEAAFRTLFRQYRLAQGALRHPWIPDLLVWKGARSRRLRRELEEIIAETRQPTEAFSWRGAARAVLLP
jgi:geranylgeranyl reductase family protein